MLSGGLAAAQDETESSSTVVYDQAFFARYSVTTAEDMLRRIPGIQDLLNGGGGGPGRSDQPARGFGSAGTQILIDGQRIAGKSNEISITLRRIQAVNVERVELIRGTSSEIDVQSEGLLVNVVLKEGAEIGGAGSWQVKGNFADDGHFVLSGLASYSDSWGALDYLVGVEKKIGYFRQNRREQWLYPDGSLLELRHELRPHEETEYVGTTNLTYGFDNGDELRLNGFVSTKRILETGRNERQPFDMTGMPLAPFTDVRTERNPDLFKWELGGEYERQVGDSGRLTFLFLYNRQTFSSNDTLEQVDATSQFPVTIQLTDRTDQESIVRATYNLPLSGAHSLEVGAEGARNSLSQTLQIFWDPERDGTISSFNFFNPDSAVKESRGEAFVKHNWSISSAASLESSLNAEISEIAQNGADVNQSRSFFFLKPRLDFRYGLSPSRQIRFKLERTVKQLDFQDFVPMFDFFEIELDAGNPDLKPEKAWEFELRYEHRLANDNGVVELRGFYNAISDHIDKGPIGVNSIGLPISANANIGKAKYYGAEIKTSLRLSFIDQPDMVVDTLYRRQGSRTTDPFTHLKRRISYTKDYRWELGFRHDVTAWAMSYGFKISQEGPDHVVSDVRTNWVFRESEKTEIFLEKTLVGSLTLRVDAEKLTRNKAHRDKTNYLTSQGVGDIWYYEILDRAQAREFTVSLRGTF